MRNTKSRKPLYISLRGGMDKDFHVRVIQEDRLIGTVPLRDMEFDEDMHDIGSSEDLPESDRIMVCQQKGIKQNNCRTD